MRILWVVAAILFAGSEAHAQDGQGTGISCRGTSKNSMQCQVENRSDRTVEVCADVALICKRGEHLATMCSGDMPPGESRPKVIAAFQPKVGIFEACMGAEIRNKRVRYVD